jgi:type I restriction-modification system DNA methylase subunit
VSGPRAHFARPFIRSEENKYMANNYGLHLGKETWKQLESIHRFGYSNSTIFSDFIDLCLFSLLSFTENLQHADIIERLKHNKLSGVYEAQYMQMVEKYKENKTAEKGKRPIDYFVSAWGALLKETWEPEQDVLGEIFMAKVSFGEHGQFFTPFNVTDMMTQMVYSEKRKPGETVCDPCCGSGRFFISFGKLNKDVHFYGVDLSPICAKMTALNMWLFNLNADIYHGDSLAMKMFHVWKIRKGGLIYESEVEEKELPMPEPIIKTLKTQAEQQKLSDIEEVKRKAG